MGEQGTDENQLVVFKFSDGKEYDGSVKRVAGSDLELNVDDLPEQAWPPIERLEARAKKSDDRYLFIDVHFRGRSWRAGRSGSSSTSLFSPSKTFASTDPDNPLSPNITSLSANVENLDLWLNKSLFKFKGAMRMSGNTLEYSTQEEIGRYDFKGFTLTFTLAISGIRFWRFTREVNLKQGASIGLHIPVGADDTSYLNLIKALRSVERLLGLAFRSPIQSVNVEVTSKDFGLTIGDDAKPNAFPAYGITLSDSRPAAPQARLGDELAFTIEQVSDFQALLDKWTALEEQITPILDLFLSSVSGGSTVLENIFLNRIQGIEGFHRSFRPGTVLPEKEYNEQKAKIINNFTDKKDIRLLKKVLGHGNDVSLAERLRVLDTELKLKGIASISVCDMDVVANTRNYYSHYEKDITKICPEDKLMQLTHEAGQMLFALILTELGIGTDVVHKAVRRTDIINPF